VRDEDDEKIKRRKRPIPSANRMRVRLRRRKATAMACVGMPHTRQNILKLSSSLTPSTVRYWVQKYAKK